jgi:hypothetical protein
LEGFGEGVGVGGPPSLRTSPTRAELWPPQTCPGPFWLVIP